MRRCPAGRQGRALALRRLRAAVWLATLLASLAWAPSAVASITEFPIPTASSAPVGITSGPDGALWFTESSYAGNNIGRITTSGRVTEFPLVPVNSGPPSGGITAGPDGALWFTEYGAIGRITTSGQVTQFPVPTAVCCQSLFGITTGPDGALWFTSSAINNAPNSSIGRITTSGQVTDFSLPAADQRPTDITTGSDGALWFTEGSGIGRLTTSGGVTDFPLPAGGGPVSGIASGPDGSLWFGHDGYIGRITTSGQITEYPVPFDNTHRGYVDGITSGPDGALWFTESSGGKIGRITTSGQITEFPVPTADSSPFGSITSGRDGALWFTEHDANNIGRITPGTSTGATPPRPGVSTAGATLVTGASATFNGSVNPNGLAASYHFEYGTSASLGNRTPSQAAGSGTSDRVVSAGVGGLIPGTIYYYRVIADNSAGESDARNVSFQTNGQPPGPLEAGAKVTPDLKAEAEGVKRQMDAIDNLMLLMKLVLVVAASDLGPELVALSSYDASYFALEVAVTKIAADPPDPYFMAVARPSVPRLRRIRAGRGISPTAARDLNGLVAIQARVAALEVAYLHSAERGQGAMRADRHDWARRQDQAKERYALQLAGDLPKLARAVKTVGPALQHSRLSRFKLTRAEAQHAQRRVARHGLPAEIARALRRFGLSPSGIGDLARRLVGLPAPRTSVRISPLGGLNPVALDRAARAFAADAARIKNLLRRRSAH